MKMKKRWIFAALVAIFALAMVGCPSDGGDDDGKKKPNPPAPGSQDDGVIRFLYKDGTWLDIEFVVGDTEWGDITSGKGTGPIWNATAWKWEVLENVKYRVDAWGGNNEKAFGGWEDADRDVKFERQNGSPSYETGTEKLNEDQYTFEPIWWSTTLTATSADKAEKVRLQNGTFVVYEFNLGSTPLTDITGITASYKFSEAGIKYNNETRVRAFGPYFFNGSASIDDSEDPPHTFWGDFTVTENGAFGARFQASGSANQTLTDFNKLNPYMINGPTTKLMASDGAAISEARVTVGARSADTWFDVAYLFGGNTGDYSYTQNLANLTASADAHLGANTSKTKVYFAIGLPLYGGTAFDVDPYDPSTGNIQLIKDVKLTINGGTTISGTIPTLSAGGTTSNQVFASYIDPDVFGWRGGVNETVQVYKGKTYVTPPPVVVPPTPDLETIVIDNPEATVYGSADNSDDETVISLANDGTLTINLRELDFNTSQSKSGIVKKSNPYYGLDDPTDSTDDELLAAWLAAGVDVEDDDFDFDDYDVTSQYIYESGSKSGVWGGGGVWYELPENFKSYSRITVEYTGDVTTGSAGNSEVFFTDNTGATNVELTYKTPQVSPKQGQASWSNIVSSDNPSRYKDIEDGSGKTYTWPISDFAAATSNGISFQINAWNDGNTPATGTFKVTKITLIP